MKFNGGPETYGFATTTPMWRGRIAPLSMHRRPVSWDMRGRGGPIIRATGGPTRGTTGSGNPGRLDVRVSCIANNFVQLLEQMDDPWDTISN